MKKLSSYLLIILIVFFIFENLNTVTAFAYTLEDSPQIIADKAITIDVDTKEIIYTKNADIKAQPASTTKLMTALLFSLYKDKNDMLTFTENAISQPSSSVYKDFSLKLSPGDLILADTVMKGLMLHSGNDMASVIAENISGDIDSFANLMNEKAKEFNMTNTHFSTPSGLDTDEALNGKEHYTTAYDLSILGNYALNDSWVLGTSSLDNIILDIDESTSINLVNGNKNLNNNGCLGGKTGFTTKAGRCLVALYERDGRKILGVVMGSTYSDYFDDMEKIIDYSYSLNPTTIYKNGEILTAESIAFKFLRLFGPETTCDIPLIINEDIYQYSNDINDNETEILFDTNIDPWNLSENSIVGTVTIKERDSSKTFNLYTNITTKDLIKENIKFYIVCVSIIIAIVILLIIIIRKKLKKKNELISHV
ncbi:MAG: D-alanyl-D-alanine carboxypeptidase [Clostridium perfringens]|nr:D-alanyl-D-alanine carboxypeptidase [Clostridium perfringens]